jgi:ubiquinone/menaquinone biosynthesis C-methylase UbiE
MTEMHATRRYFETHADRFDRLYTDTDTTTRLLRQGPRRSREFAVSVVAGWSSPSVLDVGCGPGRVAEAVIEAGAESYVGIDFSSEMLALARERLARFEDVELVYGNFLELELGRTFDIVLALGLFDYFKNPAPAAEWMRVHCSATLATTFTRWDWVEAPIRHLHYDVLNRCRTFDYTEERAEAMLTGVGFSSVEVAVSGPRGFFVLATP